MGENASTALTLTPESTREHVVIEAVVDYTGASGWRSDAAKAASSEQRSARAVEIRIR